MATIKDVALRAGVSTSTVSIILNGKAKERKISPTTQELVRAAIKELNYVPSRVARSLQGAARRKVIGLLWASDFRSTMLARFLTGLQNAMAERHLDFEISVHLYPPGQLSQQQVLAGIPPFDGLIVANADDDDLAFLSAAELPIPMALYNRHVPLIHGVAVNDEAVGALAAQAVADRARALLLSAKPAFAGMAVRDAAFSRAFEQQGGAVAEAPLADMTAQAGYEACLFALAGASASYDALYAPSDTVALGALRACHELGINIPKEIAVIAIGNGIPEYAAFSTPPLSTVEIPMEKMARTCLRDLANSMQRRAEEHDTPQARIEPRLVTRSTTTA